MELIDKVWEEYQIYGKDEIDYIDNSIEMRYTGAEQGNNSGRT